MFLNELNLINNDEFSISIKVYPDNPFKTFAYFESEDLYFSASILEITDSKSYSKNQDFNQSVVDHLLDKAKKIASAIEKGIDTRNIYKFFEHHNEPDYKKQIDKIMAFDDWIFSEPEWYEFCVYAYSKIDNYPEYQNGLIEYIEMFKNADNEFISDSIYERLSNFIKGDSITVYRGFNNENLIDGVSYTLDYNTASFFANRFGTGGYINKYNVNIEDVLAFIEKETDNEQEIITYNAILVEENVHC